MIYVVKIDNTPLKIVDNFFYLVSTLSNAMVSDEISSRLGKASTAFGKLTR